MKKLTIGEMRIIAKKRGGRCLSKRYVNSKTKLRWECKEGHVWRATPINIKQGCWCFKCVVNSQRGTIDEMQKIVKKRGGTCLSKSYVNSHTKLQWKCSQGHIWETRPHSIKNSNYWCPYCSNKAKLTIEEMRKIAKNRGGECLSKKYINNGTKLKWQCKRKHAWFSRPRDIKKGTWCPYCANKAKLTIDKMKKLAKKKGGECLSVEYVNEHTKLHWQCMKGHVWLANPREIKRGRWCPECHRENNRGNTHPNWTGGKYPYYGMGWDKANKSILKRAKDHSELSGKWGRLFVHHIVPRRNFVDKFIDLCLKPYIEGIDRLAFKVLPYDLIPQVLYDEMNHSENLIALLPSEHQVFEGMPFAFFDAVKRNYW